jgi:hypothetical protein
MLLMDPLWKQSGDICRPALRSDAQELRGIALGGHTGGTGGSPRSWRSTPEAAVESLPAAFKAL